MLDMSSKFQRAMAYVLENEGGDSDHPLDRGKATRFGITAATATRHGLNVRTMTFPQVVEVYRSEYWQGYERIADETLSIKVFDFAVNAGNGTANKTLQRAANDLGMRLEVDGVIGPKTLIAVNSLDPDVLLRRFAERQLGHYQEIVNRDPSQAVFANGWRNRAARVPLSKSEEEA
jgi:lysozyme family protein